MEVTNSAIVDEIERLEKKINTMIRNMESKIKTYSINFENGVLEVFEKDTKTYSIPVDTLEKKKALDLYLQMYHAFNSVINVLYGMKKTFIRERSTMGLEDLVMEFADTVALWRQIPNLMEINYKKRFETDLKTIELNYKLFKNHFDLFKKGEYLHYIEQSAKYATVVE